LSKRTERVADLIRREMADLLMRKLRDPRLGFVSVTGVEITADLSSAKIWLSSLDGAEKRKEIVKVLTHAAPFLRHELAPRLGLREVPELRFAYDESIERGARIEDLLKKIHDGTAIEEAGEEDGEDA